MTPRRLDALAYLLYAIIIGVLFAVYAAQGAAMGDGAPLMPVDDAYIHFQYARQAAEGQPFVYNPGSSPTSGATSLLYPFILAAGYALGFTGLNLGLWAMLVGALALYASALTVRAMSRAAGLSRWQADAMGAALAGWGSLVWHAFSGMETALVVAFVLLTLHTFERQRRAAFIVSASALAMLRPEASIMAGLAAVLYVLRELVSRRQQGSERPSPVALLLVLLPIAAAAVQPLLNSALTGTFNATGGQAKSLLSIVPFDSGYVIGRVVDNYTRAWEGFAFGIDGVGIWTVPPLLGIAALVGLLRLARRRPLTALLVAAWLLLIFGAIATLDTASWHFKRYQMPLLVLAFPLAASAAMWLSERGRARLVGYVLVAALAFNVIYIPAHRDNVQSVAAQPLAMARWLADNTPPDSLVAVHDVGLMRYVGGRDTLDMVGLTTPGMADAWRNGPGAVGEALLAMPRRPDYIAAYTDARGLSYLADSLYGEQLAGFAHEFNPSTNVALGGTFQGIFRPSWQGADAALDPHVDAIRADLDGFTLVDTLNVAHLADERAHGYAWSNVSRFDGFATEMYLLDTPGCSAESCRVLDGGRRLNGAESFTLTADPNRDHILISRVHAPDGGVLRIVINDAYTVERTLPAIPGQFVEIPTLIPASVATSASLSVRVEPVTPGALMFPYRYWLYAGSYTVQTLSTAPITFQDGAIRLAVTTMRLDDSTLTVELLWQTDGAATGDSVAFVHLYADLDAPPVLQSDARPGGGALPPGAWLPGVVTDRAAFDLNAVPAGTYTLAVGLYDPVTFARLTPTITGADFTAADGRVLITTIDIPPSE